MKCFLQQSLVTLSKLLLESEKNCYDKCNIDILDAEIKAIHKTIVSTYKQHEYFKGM